MNYILYLCDQIEIFLMNFKWNHNELTADEQRVATELGGKLGITPVLAEILVRRGITTEESARNFFRPLGDRAMGQMRDNLAVAIEEEMDKILTKQKD
jgi:single-stranded-DNA-specific exonuclease